MQEARQVSLEIKELVIEASQALAKLDAGRLEELAASCKALNRDLPPLSDQRRAEFAAQARDAAREMDAFGRVLMATRANLHVIRRLSELQDGQLEYAGGPESVQWDVREICHGNN